MTADGGHQTLAGIDLFTGMPAEVVKTLEQACRWKRYKADEQIIDRDSDSRDVHFVVAGKVRVVNYSLSGREVTLDDLAAASYFGELAAIDGQPRSAGVMAVTDALIASLPQGQFLELLRRQPELAMRVMLRLARIVRTATGRIMDLSTLGANNRVHAELLRLARKAAPEGDQALISPVPVHSDVASRVSTTRETVARVISALTQDGILEKKKDGLLVKNIERLQDMVEDVKGE